MASIGKSAPSTEFYSLESGFARIGVWGWFELSAAKVLFSNPIRLPFIKDAFGVVVL